MSKSRRKKKKILEYEKRESDPPERKSNFIDNYLIDNAKTEAVYSSSREAEYKGESSPKVNAYR
ncbi:hypothetical protein Avbf_04702 [Armadillidium vulgare]|nr:hypothetical protein Avbf_04702 [Armadillidium vulgare]